MTDASIVIPTFRHPLLLPHALRSALAQEGVEVEVLVVGDGVEDDTRAALEPFLADSRVRVFDFEKGERHGERHRDGVVRGARGDVVCYLSDDDLLFPHHVAEMIELLQRVDFAYPPPVIALPDGVLRYRPGDLSQPEFFALIRAGRNNFVSLTGASHTRAAYARLPHGWRAAPPGKPTDIHMWEQFAALPGLSGAGGRRLTAIHFPDPDWSVVDQAARAAELESWLGLYASEGADGLDGLLAEAVLRAAQEFKLRTIRLSDELDDARREIARLSEPFWKRPARRVKRSATRLRAGVRREV